jgi:RNA polymerase sigma-70 factor, ECF subfamily
MSQTKIAIASEIPRLRRYARALSGSETEADDLVQETLTRALSHLDHWREGDSPRKWLFSILHNHFIDQVRRTARRPHHVSIDAGDVTPVDIGEDPGTRRDLDQGLQALSVDQRQILLLVGLEGMSYAEAAQLLDVPIGTVMSRLARARERLRVLMACDIGPNDAPLSFIATFKRSQSQ